MPKGQKHHVRVMAESVEIAHRLRKTRVTMRGMMYEYQCGYAVIMRAILSQMTLGQYRILARKRLGRGGVKHRFKLGHETWNAGMKGRSPPGCEATQFKPGCLRGNAARKYRGIGSVTIRRQPSRWIKVDEGKYIPYARYLWEKEHGPVPAGRFVVHANHRTMDDRLENLVMVDCVEQMRRLGQRPDVEARRIKMLRRASARRRPKDGPARRWAKGQTQQSRTIRECKECGAEVEAVRCPKCGSGSITQTHIRPMPDSMVREGMLQEVGT